MESEEIHTKKKVKMQAAAFKDKKQKAPANKEGADNPDYENITLTFRNQDQLKGRHSPSKDQHKQPPANTHRAALGGAHGRASPEQRAPVPTPSRWPSDSAQVPRCLHRALMSLHIILILSCVILLAVVLAKNSEMSRELLVLKRELWNVSTLVRACQEEQNQGWSSVQKLVTEAKQDINVVKRDVQAESARGKTLSADMNQIKNKLQEISKALEKSPSSCKLGLRRWVRREPWTWSQFPSWGRDLPDLGSPSHTETSTNGKTSKTQLHLPVKPATCVYHGVL